MRKIKIKHTKKNLHKPVSSFLQNIVKWYGNIDVSCYVTVNDGARLTIEPGAIVNSVMIEITRRLAERAYL